MPSTATAAEDVVASCSFCGRPDTDVQRLVAGPGVYICNECVDLAAWVLDEAARATPEEASRRRMTHHNPSTEEILATLPALVRSADRVANELAASVGRVRARGTDWQTIAVAAGMGADAARHRFGAVAAE